MKIKKKRTLNIRGSSTVSSTLSRMNKTGTKTVSGMYKGKKATISLRKKN